MTFKREDFEEADYETTAKILYNDGIIFADDKRFNCFHNSITYTVQLKRILREKIAQFDSQYDYDEDDDNFSYDEENQQLLLSVQEPNAKGNWLYAIYTTEKFEPEEALNLVRNRKTP
ncbi:hypothetical protein [Schinkia azotoformans]|uniref:hypothetical protein n=1 Tax=Schinkia azotoformans TaxID=1454 RepID=UPI002DBBFF4D|nr:hypothetical protein [Schinkia azotoformans]MEC1718412.1 hypothetical protein [Schinkia azotoformans]MEC1756229.1 hypothetical protein [Schinkia azotoformans]